ncbi:ganglioside-induced differentiation-associated protein 1-like [Glandiceps talaboti]
MADLILYQYDLSFYSQIVRSGFAEKNLSYKNRDVDLPDLDQLAPSFVKLNPKCQVPVLEHGESVIPESLEILKYIDETFPDTKKLCPDTESEEGERCAMFQEMADYFAPFKILIDVPWYPDVSETTDSSANRKKTMAQCLLKLIREEVPKRCDKLSEENPDLKDAYMEKKAEAESLPEEPDSEELKKHLVHFGDVMVKLERELERVEEEFEKQVAKEEEEEKEKDGEKKPEPFWWFQRKEKKECPKWLCGDNYNVADIYWSVILYHLEEAGLAGRFWANGKHPHVAAYYERVKDRSSYKKALPPWSALFFQALKYSCTIL